MNISRREAIAGTVALLGGFAMGKPTRGAMGAAGASQTSASGWVNPYVTDGLIAMWDGEWNAGGGVHDPEATVWKDLSGYGYDLPLPSSFSVGSDNMLALSKEGAIMRRPQSVYEAIVASGGYTIEVAFDATMAS